jgi:hypothetical protein
LIARCFLSRMRHRQREFESAWSTAAKPTLRRCKRKKNGREMSMWDKCRVSYAHIARISTALCGKVEILWRNMHVILSRIAREIRSRRSNAGRDVWIVSDLF